MRRLLPLLALPALLACERPAPRPTHLVVWAGDSAGTASDFLGVLDATPGSPTYGRIVASLAVGDSGTHPHHTEAVMPANGHLLANGFGAGRTWRFDLTDPTRPRILSHLDDVGGFSHPHTFLRLANGHVLVTFQYAADSGAAAPMPHHGGGAAHAAATAPAHRTGGIVEMTEEGTVIRAASAGDRTIPGGLNYPYSFLPLPAINRGLSTTTDMDEGNVAATSEWLQLWDWQRLAPIGAFALPPGPRGDEHRFTGEPFLLADGKRALVHTFMCGLYLVDGLEGASPRGTFVYGFPGKDCGVPVLAGRWFLQTVPATHGVIVLDVADPAHPVKASEVSLGAREAPHWLSMDATGRRLVVNSGGSGERLFVLTFDPETGRVAVDSAFRDAGSTEPGVSMRGAAWPHGFRGFATPHGAVFTR